jgi:hypothetical protein
MVSEDSVKLRLIAGIWPVGLTVNVCDTGGAAANVALSPGCVAVMVQVPALTNAAVHVDPDCATVQTEVVPEAKLTAKPEVADAVNVSGVPTTCVPGFANVMVWVGSAESTAIVSCACGAAV